MAFDAGDIGFAGGHWLAPVLGTRISVTGARRCAGRPQCRVGLNRHEFPGYFCFWRSSSPRERPMISFMISLLPAKILEMRALANMREIGYSSIYPAPP